MRQLAYEGGEVNEDEVHTPARRTGGAIGVDELASAIGTAIKAAAKSRDYSSDEGEEEIKPSKMAHALANYVKGSLKQWFEGKLPNLKPFNGQLGAFPAMFQDFCHLVSGEKILKTISGDCALWSVQDYVSNEDMLEIVMTTPNALVNSVDNRVVAGLIRCLVSREILSASDLNGLLVEGNGLGAACYLYQRYGVARFSTVNPRLALVIALAAKIRATEKKNPQVDLSNLMRQVDHAIPAENAKEWIKMVLVASAMDPVYYKDVLLKLDAETIPSADKLVREATSRNDLEKATKIAANASGKGGEAEHLSLTKQQVRQAIDAYMTEYVKPAPADTGGCVVIAVGLQHR